ncbi:hypothetical protein ACVNPS_02155 [Candidatus Bipolaricaulota sp. J31]
MRGVLGPGLLIVAALALPFPLAADTGGAVTATLVITAEGGPIGGAGGLEGACVPVYGPPYPVVQVVQHISLFHDLDGDGLLDPGDMVAYSAEVESLSPRPLEGLRVLIVFHKDLDPVGFPEEWQPLELGALRAFDVALPPLSPFGRARLGFTARFAGTQDDAPTVFAQAFLYSEGLYVAADDTATATVLDPLLMAVRDVAGGAAASFPGPGVFTKEVVIGSGATSRVVSPGDVVEFRISYVTSGGDGTVEVMDLVPPPLRLRPETLTVGDVETIGGTVSLIRARFAGLALGDRVTLRYRAEVGGEMAYPFLATRALAILPGGDVIFSDDPETASPGDPTALLFPWTSRDWSPELWEMVSQRASCIIPVIVRDAEGNDSLRWTFWGNSERSPAGPGDLVLAEFLEVPIESLTGKAGLGFLLARLPPGFEEAYVPGVYGAPVFVPLSDGVSVMQGLKGVFCEHLYLPLLVQLPSAGPVYLTGVVVDEDT